MKVVRTHPIEIDTLLNGHPTWSQVVEWFKDSCDAEHWFVKAIEKHLQTEEQRRQMFDAKFSIEDMLNGRVPGNSELVAAIFAAWNAKLGFRHFGF